MDNSQNQGTTPAPCIKPATFPNTLFVGTNVKIFQVAEVSKLTSIALTSAPDYKDGKSNSREVLFEVVKVFGPGRIFMSLSASDWDSFQSACSDLPSIVFGEPLPAKEDQYVRALHHSIDCSDWEVEFIFVTSGTWDYQNWLEIQNVHKQQLRAQIESGMIQQFDKNTMVPLCKSWNPRPGTVITLDALRQFCASLQIGIAEKSLGSLTAEELRKKFFELGGTIGTDGKIKRENGALKALAAFDGRCTKQISAILKAAQPAKYNSFMHLIDK